MNQEIKCVIHSKYNQKYKSGYPLLTKEVFKNTPKKLVEGDILYLEDESHKFIGKGYYGKQNKGCGWIITYEKDQPLDQAFFDAKIQQAVGMREEFFHNDRTNAFRIFNGAGDGIGGLTIDYYNGFYLINWYSIGIYQFKQEIVEAIKKQQNVKGIYQKKRFDQAGKYIEDDDFIYGTRSPQPLIVQENAVKFAIYLNEGAMVGVFLDQREVRQRIKEYYAKDKTVLNTFSYTGAFSVFAALGGATKTTSVDLANRSNKKTIEQFMINEIDYKKQDIIVEDVFHYFKYAKRKKLLFDLVIVDPPSFAKSKKNIFRASKDYKELLKEVISITSDNGVIVASTNCSSFDMKTFHQFIHQAFQELNGRYQILEEFSLPEDFKAAKEFPEDDYLKVVFVKKIH